MAMLDSFFNKRFNAGKCKIMLKLTIPRIKLLRNRKEVQLKQMRREIAKLLETGQEATARIKVEHIIREEKMMAAQEIIELFCELITVRLPIIEVQRECPLDLKEAISSVCFAAPRCADLTELLQVQLLFSGKYGKEFVTAATELMPECGVNRQLVELLSIRAPAPDVKLKLLKEIAEEHELDWDPSASESELLKPHEDLLNGPTQFVSSSKLPLPKEKHDETGQNTSENASSEKSDFEEDFDIIDFPEVPVQPLQSRKVSGSAPEMLPFPSSALSEIDDQEETEVGFDNDHVSKLKPEETKREAPILNEGGSINISAGPIEEKQFLPFLYPPSQSPASFSARENDFTTPPPQSPASFSALENDFATRPSQSRASFSAGENDFPPSASKTNSDNIDLQDVLAAAYAAAESAERAAASARLAASIAECRISGLTKKDNDGVSVSTIGNPYAFHFENSMSGTIEKVDFDNQKSFGDSENPVTSPNQNNDFNHHATHQPPAQPSFDQNNDFNHHATHQPPAQPSFDDDAEGDVDYGSFIHNPGTDGEPYFTYPNLFTSQASNLSSGAESFKESK